MDYEAHIRVIMFGDSNCSDRENTYFLKDYCIDEFCIALLHQLSLVYLHRLDFKSLVRDVLFTIKDDYARDFNIKEKGKVTESFQRYLGRCESNRKPMVDEFKAEFRKAFIGYTMANSLAIKKHTEEDILNLTKKLRITLIYMIAGANFNWRIFNYGEPICVIFKEKNGRYSSINSAHLSISKTSDPNNPKNYFWPISWNPSLPKNIDFIKKFISKVIAYKNTDQSIQYKIFDFLKQYPWHFDLFKPYLEFLTKANGYSIYSMIRAIDPEKIYCRFCFRHIPKTETCFTCLLKLGYISELRKQNCKACNKPISSLPFITYGLTIIHHTCFGYKPLN
ncbi:hypothetical protein SteCoe_3384 [Stentor coeruleus]|uniref:Uncharacterized protein n=1 Tax=Stentor coeruleus TaxID=5963 RepID=A0A1R2CX51_9CILI|nr:hypothetical protein SteCoe_3384 [Stentor coeruleus]